MLGEPSHPTAPSASPGGDGRTLRRHHRRPRAQLSCGECRSKKLSCDRNLPCQRCVKSGKPERCSFASGARPVPKRLSPVPTSLSSDRGGQTQELRQVFAEQREHCHPHDGVVRSVLALPNTLWDTNCIGLGQTSLTDGESQRAPVLDLSLTHAHTHHDPKEPFSRSVQGYYRQHSLFRFFAEIPELFPIIKETANEHFRPRNISLRKAKLATADALNLDAARLEALLPPDKDTEQLLSAYFDDFENVHRVVHLPSHYPLHPGNFVAGVRGSNNDSMIARVLSMITLSVTISLPNSSRRGSDALLTIVNQYKRTVPTWINACERWLRLRSSKSRDLVYYQISCLVYLAKRMNGIKKKRFWNETGALIQEAVMDGLHRDPPSTDSPYSKEMQRRIWSTLRELDLQNSFEHGLPTLLHCLDSDVAAPANVEDHEFNEESEAIPTKPESQYQYTRTSYQHLSARSWRLRLDISRLLYGAGSTKPPSHEEVLRYTHEITEALDALPPLAIGTAGTDASSRSNLESSMLAKTFLICQLKECMLALHRHRLQRGGADFSSFSESICYAMAKDMLLLNNAAQVNLRGPNLLRADILTASLTITRICLQQPATHHSDPLLAAAMNIDSPDYGSALGLLEQCLPSIEERYLHCFNGEPWCPLTMLGATMLLKIHLGKESRQTAKTSTAQRFLDLYYRHLAEQETASPAEDDLMVASGELVNFDLCDFDFDWDKFMGEDQSGG